DLDGGIEESHDRVQDHENGARLCQGVVEDFFRSGNSKGPGLFEALVGEDESAVEIGAKGAEAGDNGVLRIVLAVEDDDVGRLEGGAASGQVSAGGNASAEVESDEGLADLRIAIEHTYLAAGQAAGPEPGYLARRKLAERGD